MQRCPVAFSKLLNFSGFIWINWQCWMWARPNYILQLVLWCFVCVCVLLFLCIGNCTRGEGGAGRRKKCADPKQKGFFFTPIYWSKSQHKICDSEFAESGKWTLACLWLQTFVVKKWQTVIRDWCPIVAYADMSVPNQNLTMFWKSGVLDVHAKTVQPNGKLCPVQHESFTCFGWIILCIRFSHRLCWTMLSLAQTSPM